MLRPERSQHNAEQAYYQHRNDQERFNIANTPTIARREIRKQKSSTETVSRKILAVTKEQAENQTNNKANKESDDE